MSTNWECPECQALNPPRRQKCWQCHSARPAIPGRPSAGGLSAPLRPAVEPGLRRSQPRIELETLFQPAPSDARIGDRVIAFLVGLAFSLAALWIISAPLRAVDGRLSWLGGLGALVLLLVGQWLLLTAAFVSRRLYFLQLGILGAGGLVYFLVWLLF